MAPPIKADSFEFVEVSVPGDPQDHERIVDRANFTRSGRKNNDALVPHHGCLSADPAVVLGLDIGYGPESGQANRDTLYRA